MEGAEPREDVGFLLSFVPFVASAAYALALWVPRGLSGVLPPEIFLSVTKDPVVFLVGYGAPLVGGIFEVRAAQKPAEKVEAVARRLQLLALLSLILALLMAWYTTGYGPAGVALGLLVAGRYALLFPAALLLTSLGLGLAKTRDIDRKAVVTVGAVALLIASAIVLFTGSQTPAPWPLVVAAAAVLLVAGIMVLVGRKN